MTATTTSATVEHDDYPGRLLMEAKAEIERLRAALSESVKLQSHYADILNAYDGGQRMLFNDANAWLRRLEHVRAAARVREARICSDCGEAHD